MGNGTSPSQVASIFCMLSPDLPHLPSTETLFAQADAAQTLLKNMLDAHPHNFDLQAALSCWAQSIQTVTAAYARSTA